MGGGLGTADEAGVPEEVTFQPKPQLARMILERAFEAGVPVSWVTGDEVYGGDRRLRVWLEEQEVPHVLAVRSNEPLWVATDRGPAQIAAAKLVAQVSPAAWVRLSAGEGAKGPRVYDWALVAIRPLKEPGQGYWLLARRNITQPEELAYYVCFGPQDTSLEELIRVAGMRGPLRRVLKRPKGKWGWTSMRCVDGWAGTGISPWCCWPMLSWR
jgi:SRSO17 transposase